MRGDRQNWQGWTFRAPASAPFHFGPFAVPFDYVALAQGTQNNVWLLREALDWDHWDAKDPSSPDFATHLPRIGFELTGTRVAWPAHFDEWWVWYGPISGFGSNTPTILYTFTGSPELPFFRD